MYIFVAQKLPEIWPETWMYQFCNFCIFWVLVKKIRQFLQNLVFAKKYFLTFLAISPAIFKLQRCIIPHFNPLNNSFWPYEEQFCCRVNTFWVIRPNVSTIFFYPHFNSEKILNSLFSVNQIFSWGSLRIIYVSLLNRKNYHSEYYERWKLCI